MMPVVGRDTPTLPMPQRSAQAVRKVEKAISAVLKIIPSHRMAIPLALNLNEV
jgi:hypothetical protein